MLTRYKQPIVSPLRLLQSHRRGSDTSEPPARRRLPLDPTLPLTRAASDTGSPAPAPSTTTQPAAASTNPDWAAAQLRLDRKSRLAALFDRLQRFVSSGNYNESYACFVTFGILFLVDFSLLSLVFVVGVFG